MTQDKLRFFRDGEGAPRAEGFDPETQVLALFLESDLQDDSSLCREVLARMAEGSPAHGNRAEFIGNSFVVGFGPDGVVLTGHPEGNRHNARVDPRRVEKAVREWLEFIET
jgi:hypothetical protein